MTRRDLLLSSLALAIPAQAQPRKWQLGYNTYCLRFERWNDRQLFDYCTQQKLDAIFLQDSLDPGVRDLKLGSLVGHNLDNWQQLDASRDAIIPAMAECAGNQIKKSR